MVMLFNSVREPLIIILTIPLGLIGVVLGLFVTGFPFGFIALLGILSLAGMMIKNVIVLLDEIRSNKADGLDPHTSIVNEMFARDSILGSARGLARQHPPADTRYLM